MALPQESRAELPDRHVYVPRDEISVKDILAVRNNPDDSYEDDVQIWTESLQKSLEVVGIGTLDGPHLVAVGFLGGELRLATLRDIATHPDFCRHHFGRTIAERLVETADRRGVQRIITEEVTSRGQRDMFRRLGFLGLGPHLYRDHPQI